MASKSLPHFRDLLTAPSSETFGETQWNQSLVKKGFATVATIQRCHGWHPGVTGELFQK